MKRLTLHTGLMDSVNEKKRSAVSSSVTEERSCKIEEVASEMGLLSTCPLKMTAEKESIEEEARFLKLYSLIDAADKNIESPSKSHLFHFV